MIAPVRPSTSHPRHVVAVAAVMALVAAGCADDDGSAGPEVSTAVEDIVDEELESQGDPDPIIDPLADDPLSPLVGQDVTVSGDIGLIVDPTLFEIAGDTGSLLVIWEEGLDGADVASLVQVTGTVRQVLADTFETEFGYTFDPAIYGTAVERLAIDADDVVVLEGEGEEGGPPADNGEFDELNGSEVDGDVAIVIDGSTMQVTLSAENLSAALPHAMHVHFDPGQAGECPDLDEFDVDGDQLLTTAEGVPAYGPVQYALTTDGDTGPDSGLALERFPVADADGRVEYQRDIDLGGEEIPTDTTFAVVIHGMDIDESGDYDGERESSIDPSVPLEATIPVACATIELS